MSDSYRLSDIDAAVLLKDHSGFDVSSLPNIPEGFVYDATRPSTSPRWTKGEGDKRLSLSIADPDPAKRASRYVKHYTLVVGQARTHTLLAMDDWEPIEAAIGYVSDSIALGGGCHSDIKGRDYVRMNTGEKFFTDEEAERHDRNFETLCCICDPDDLLYMIAHATGRMSDSEFHSTPGNSQQGTAKPVSARPAP